MARARSSNGDKAFERYKEHNGDSTNREIAGIFGEDEKRLQCGNKGINGAVILMLYNK